MQALRIGGPKGTEDTINLATTDAATDLDTLGATIDLIQSGAVGSANTKGADGAVISVETNSVRFGKGSITAVLGHLAGPGDIITLDSRHELQNFKFISAVAGLSASLQTTIQYFK